MDQMGLAAAWMSVRNSGDDLPPGIDPDIRFLILEHRAQEAEKASLRLDLAVGLAELLEGLAARLRGETRRLAVTHL